MEGSSLVSNGFIKSESAFSDEIASANPPEEDVYEDAGDLDFTGFSPDIFLTRMPLHFWRMLSSFEGDQEIEIGRIRVEGPLHDPKAMSLMLSLESPLYNTSLPREYHLPVTNQSASNTFVFTEKDLPGFNNRVKAFDNVAQDTTALPFSKAQPRAPLPDRLRPAVSKVDKLKRTHGYFRRAIPKHTALTGKVRTELNCLPVENEDFRRAMREKNDREAKPVRETILLPGFGMAHGSGAYELGTAGAISGSDKFIKTASTSRSKGQENKTARIPQNELIDMIVDCFKKFRYWSFATLKAEVRQPEAYLRQTLELVADLMRSGPNSGQWQLKEEYRAQDYAPAETAAPESGTDFGE